ncbi:hypothetical protein JSE7799_01236 [Jannaschia seosinensis]|uniref:Uncharacterized protein n=1 Tax=Jannaschia seosinensis TaxID=313367 RepID=A0A0M7B836_9RHOB|nr:hypothetical protein JSE7799_01236 [Jannaschia seosinensis]
MVEAGSHDDRIQKLSVQQGPQKLARRKIGDERLARRIQRIGIREIDGEAGRLGLKTADVEYVAFRRIVVRNPVAAIVEIPGMEKTIRTGPAVKPVPADAAGKEIVALTAEKPVAPGAAVQEIVAAMADDRARPPSRP